MAPTRVYRSGSFKNETISSNSAFASSIPAISSNEIPVSGFDQTVQVIFLNSLEIEPEFDEKLSEFWKKKTKPPIKINGKSKLLAIVTKRYFFLEQDEHQN